MKPIHKPQYPNIN